MPVYDTESQFKFLIACIKHSSAGKVDFTRVANELGIVSKGAAAKRYERLMKAHGISGSASGRNTATPGPSAPSTPGSSSKTASAKKRKTMHSIEDADDEEEVKTEVKTEGIKPETKDSVKIEFDDMADVDGSYTHPNASESAAAATLVTIAEGARPNMNDDDEVFLISATERMHDSAVGSQMYPYQDFPTPLESCAVVDHNDFLRHPQTAQLATMPPFEFNADFTSLKVSNNFDPGLDGNWAHPHDPVFFWNDMVGLDVPHSLDHA